MGRDAPDWDALPEPDAGGTDPPPSKIIIPMAAQAPGYFVTLEGKIFRPLMVDAEGRLVVTTQAADGSTIVVVCGGEDPDGANPPIAVTPAGCLRIGGLGDDGLWHCYATDKQGFFPIAAFRQPSGDLDGIVSSPDGELVVAGKDPAGAYKALLSTTPGILRAAPAWEAMGYSEYNLSPAPHASTQRLINLAGANEFYILQHAFVEVEPTTAVGDAEVIIEVGGVDVLHVRSGTVNWHWQEASCQIIAEQNASIRALTINADGVARRVHAAYHFASLTV